MNLLALVPHIHRARRVVRYADGSAVEHCRCGRWRAVIPGRWPGGWRL